ncbi:hypothetical protein EJB05_56612, partial [Eragrostis curvula]
MAAATGLGAVDDGRSPAIGGGDGDAAATTIEDLPADVLALVLRRLDGASLAALGCACSSFHDLATDPATWRGLCLAMWPSVRDVPCCGGSDGGVGHRALFADAFPFPAPSTLPSPSPAPPSAPVDSARRASSLPELLVSAVDLHHGGACIMSRVVETDTASAWFLGSPFRVDALVQEGFTAPSPITPSDLTLSWILIDPSTGRAVNASSRRPVSVDRKWLTGDVVARFTLVLCDGVALDAAVTCDERHGHVREVSLCVEDGDGGGVSGHDGLAAVAAAMAGARRGLRGAEDEAKRRYREFVKGKKARKEWKARREGMLDLCCSGVGAAAFVSFLVMLMFR